MDDDAGGLVDDQQVLVLVGDPEVHLLRLQRGRNFRRQLDLELLTALQAVALRSHAPSTRTAPDASRRSAAEREPISGSSARNRSRRSPAASSGTRVRNVWNRPRPLVRALGKQQRGEEDEDAEDDEAVGQVESRPEAEVDEVGHVAEPDPVE